MDLTLPTHPGALLGYRRNGQPIYLAAGGDDTADVDEDTTDDPEVEPATGDDDDADDRLTEANNRAAEAQVEATATRVAAGIGRDALALLDSLAFRNKLDRIDAEDLEEFAEEAEKLMREQLKKAGRKPAGPSTSGGEFTGGSGAGSPITDAQLAKMSPDQIAQAFEQGRLKHML